MDERILVLAPYGRDAPVICETLSAIGQTCRICEDLADLTDALHEGAGTAILTEEALAEGTTEMVVDWLERQPPWSDFPFIVLVTRQPGRRTKSAAARLQAIGNIVLLERPINAETLCRAAESALRGRRRQYAARQHLTDQAASEAKLRFALDAAGLGAWEIDIETGALTASDTAKRHFGKAPTDAVSYGDVKRAVHPDDQPAHRAAVAHALAAGQDLDIEYRVVWPDGSVHWLQVRGRILPKSGASAGTMSGVTMDVTDRRFREEQFQRLNAALEGRVVEGTEQLREANRLLLLEIREREQAQAALVQAQKMDAIGQLTGGIAHDFNNLLTAILGNVDMIERRSADERITRMAGYARQAVDRATRLTGQLLAFSRSQQLDLQPVAVDDLVRGMDDLLTRTLGHTVTVHSELDAGGERATADPTQLELAILNLAINARDAMPGGGVLTIATRVTDEWIEGLLPRRHLVISVADTGQGIPAHLLDKVFDPFFTTKSVGRGTGLGLSQVYGIATQSGGTARIKTVVGAGTTVEVWLPVDEASEARRSPVAAEGDLAMGAGQTVLVVDDDPDVRLFIVSCLETLGYEVICAETGQAGLDLLTERSIDLLVVDFAMPGMTGVELADHARGSAPNLPVLLVTGYADARAIEDLAQAEAILRKPFKVADLAHAVSRLLSQPIAVG
jgi:PAS domain S-box-containing protein